MVGLPLPWLRREESRGGRRPQGNAMGWERVLLTASTTARNITNLLRWRQPCGQVDHVSPPPVFLASCLCTICFKILFQFPSFYKRHRSCFSLPLLPTAGTKYTCSPMLDYGACLVLCLFVQATSRNRAFNSLPFFTCRAAGSNLCCVSPGRPLERIEPVSFFRSASLFPPLFEYPAAPLLYRTFSFRVDGNRRRIRDGY